MAQQHSSQKIWFITGASKGFGLALVKLLLDNGNKVTATSRNHIDIEKKITAHRENLLALTVDITDDISVKNAIDQTVKHFGRLDVVVNNAGYAILGGLEEITEQEFRQSTEVNVYGTVNVIRNAMPYLRKQGSGYFINFTSSGGFYGSPYASSYSAAKFAIVGITEALAEEVKDFGIKVTVVAPGYFRTSFLESGSILLAQNKLEGYGTALLEEQLKQFNGNQPGDPNKLVAALVNMAEEENPPVHLLMGPDAYQTVTEKRKAEDQEFEDWKHITCSTNFD